MPRKVALADARDHLTLIVRDVERGQYVTLTRRGEPVAMILSCSEFDRLKNAKPSLVDALHAWRKGAPADFEGLSPDEVQGARDRSEGRPVKL
ncbi:MAG: type II toxin-antitoxin system prevent-host-death family antitoxin [Polyangiales bacterium]